MNPTIKAGIHNKFDIVVKDAKTGTVKQHVYAYNVVLNQLLTTWCTDKATQYQSYPTNFISSIEYGTGTGVPAATDTALFTLAGTVATALVETVYAYPTSHQSAAATLGVGDANGKTITEVGIFGASSCRYSSDWFGEGCLISHAMLQDSEGNTISIVKNDTEIIVITATVYVTIANTSLGTGALYPDPADNRILKDIFTTYPTAHSIYMTNMPITTCKDILLCSSKTVDAKGACSTVSGSGIFNWPQFVLAPADLDKRSIRYLGDPLIGLVHFPNHDIFPPYAVSLALGSGDGVTTDFNVGCPHIMNGSETVTVGGAAKTKGTDYTINYDPNPMAVGEESLSAQLFVGSGVTAFGSMGSDDYVGPYSDPFDCTGKHKISCVYHGYNGPSDYWMNVNGASYPIKVDFGSAKKCNYILINQDYWTHNLSIGINLIIEYSSDNVNWTAVTNKTVTTLTASATYKFDAVSAQYWRAYSSSGAWHFSISTLSMPAFAVGYSEPGLHFLTPPASGSAVAISYTIDIPYKTANNKLTFNCGFQIGRG